MRARAIPVESHLAVLCVLAGVVLLFFEPLVPVSVAAGVAYYKARTRTRAPRAVAAPAEPAAREPHPAVELRRARVLVLLGHQPRDDAALVRLGASIAREGELTVAQLAALDAPVHALLAARRYHEQLAPLEVDACCVLVRSRDPLQSLLELAGRHDVLLTAESAGALSDRLRARAPCVVLALRPHPWEHL